MSAATDVYSRISEKMRNENFTEEEIKTVEKAKGQLSSYGKKTRSVSIHPTLDYGRWWQPVLGD